MKFVLALIVLFGPLACANKDCLLTKSDRIPGDCCPALGHGPCPFCDG